MTLQRGHLLDSGRYRIVRPLGQGGYGFVYLAEDTRLGEPVAIKELISALVDDQATVKRFVQEARATMRLTHPSLVHTRDVFHEGDNWYTVMDYLPGGSLADRMGRGPVPVDEALQTMTDLCAGLEYVHAQGVVHCDIKPANVLFDKRGRARLTDFGIAHVPAEFSSHSWRTNTGFAAGTLCYMSPEQTDGVRGDVRVDIYALGVLLYEMLAGRSYLEFDRRNTPSAHANNINTIKTQMPEPLKGVPGQLNTAVMRALAKKPEDRYATAGEFQAALVLKPVDPVANLDRWDPRTRLESREKRLPAFFWLVVGILFSLLLAGGGILAARSARTGEVEKQIPGSATPSAGIASAMPTFELGDISMPPAATLQPTDFASTTSTPQGNLQFTAQLVWDPLVAPNCAGPSIAAQSVIRDTRGNPVNGARVEVSCYDNIWVSHPTGSPGEYELGHYGVSFGQSVPQDWNCTARVVEVNGQPVTSSEVVSIHFDTNDCKPEGNGHQVAIINWTMHSDRVQNATPTPAPVPTGTPPKPSADGAPIRLAGSMVYIPSGKFLMGSTDSDEDAADDEKPLHTVNLDGFWIDLHEVTNREFGQFVAESGYQTTAEQEGWARVWTAYNTWEKMPNADWQHPAGPESTIFGLDGHPVVAVSWYDAESYCQWAGGRLPTEAEWEKTARGTGGVNWPWGNTWSCETGNYDDETTLDSATTGCQDGYARTAPVGAFPQGMSPYGVYDLAGNVSEWVADWYDADYYAQSETNNPSGPSIGTERVLRGGGWFTVDVHASARRQASPSERAETIGFRCAFSDGAMYHTVQSGQTLSEIATLYGITPQAIVDANGLVDPNRIITGQKLMIPAPEDVTRR